MSVLALCVNCYGLNSLMDASFRLKWRKKKKKSRDEREWVSMNYEKRLCVQWCVYIL